jgi:hypothetical protein
MSQTRALTPTRIFVCFQALGASPARTGNRAQSGHSPALAAMTGIGAKADRQLLSFPGVGLLSYTPRICYQNDKSFFLSFHL